MWCISELIIVALEKEMQTNLRQTEPSPRAGGRISPLESHSWKIVDAVVQRIGEWKLWMQSTAVHHRGLLAKSRLVARSPDSDSKAWSHYGKASQGFMAPRHSQWSFAFKYFYTNSEMTMLNSHHSSDTERETPGPESRQTWDARREAISERSCRTKLGTRSRELG